MGTRPAPPTLVSLRPSACPKLLRRLTTALPPRRRSQDKFFAWANVNSLTELMNIEEGERTVPMLFKLLEDAKPLGADGRQRMQEELISHANLAKKMAMRVRGWGAFFGDMDRGSR